MVYGKRDVTVYTLDMKLFSENTEIYLFAQIFISFFLHFIATSLLQILSIPQKPFHSPKLKHIQQAKSIRKKYVIVNLCNKCYLLYK